METLDAPDIDARLAERLRGLRSERGLTLDALATYSGVSRATLSRLENGEVSPTASVLNRLCAAYGMTMSRLMAMVEGEAEAHIRRAAQPVWRDAGTGFLRRAVSPPGAGLAGEVVEGELPAGGIVSYEATPRPGLEHHLVLLDGSLALSVESRSHDLRPGDCLRYRLFGPSRFVAGPAGARYLLFML